VEKPSAQPGALGLIFGSPVLLTLLAFGLMGAVALMGPAGSTMALVVGASIVISAVIFYVQKKDEEKEKDVSAGWHHLVEGKALAFTVLTIGSILVGGIAEIVPLVIAGNEKLAIKDHAPYTPLELEGRDVFLKEGCYNCHSQMVRPFAWETARFGAPSVESDSKFDHPFQWGSKRTGPDLAHLGGRYTDVWHYRHMLDPRELSPGSNMPGYAHLQESLIDFNDTPDKLRAMRTVGVPYTPERISAASGEADQQATQIATGLAKEAGARLDKHSELVALISFLQRLGKSGVTDAPTNGSATPALARTGGM
jgi:cytochrome c oxidase cbb3-type subunit I/II